MLWQTFFFHTHANECICYQNILMSFYTFYFNFLTLKILLGCHPHGKVQGKKPRKNVQKTPKINFYIHICVTNMTTVSHARML